MVLEKEPTVHTDSLTEPCVAQLGERIAGSDALRDSIPLGSIT